MKVLTIEGATIRMDQETGFICITDMAKLKGDPSLNIANWMRNRATVEFIEAWELKHNPSFNPFEFEGIKSGAGSNTFYVSTKDLEQAGCTGVFVKRGRYGGTYCSPQWAIHFANWLSAAFYVETVDAYLQAQELLYGKDAQLKRFSRELAAETYPLAAGQAQQRLPRGAKLEMKLLSGKIVGDIINLAMWGMTSQEWKIKFPQRDARKNMRDYATAEELKVVSALQVLSQSLQEDQYTSEELLERLTDKVPELMTRFCRTEKQQAKLTAARADRGW
ncbi:hypothetical protein LEM8419_03473 [Neolewinella maritima]|uniref:KilA-N domain-containing protein n=1 Tax=Neolewinella maritima TaxID=1383882 RepID=A0ABM9B5J2_9BACT|nr:KilA-N domain-containing protein [Neolewinella maritima]CAH1002601.1 hypothetical protein LEM8419_03473 [Neolewinella maritima]